MRRRPRSLWIAAALQVIQGLALIALGSQALVSQGQPFLSFLSSLTPGFTPKTESLLFPVSMIVIGSIIVLCTLALIRLSRWAWTISMGIQGIGLAAGLVAYAFHQPNFIMMAMGVILVFYLNHQEIQATFREKREVV